MSDTYSFFVPGTVLITGATGDFGQAFARRFASMGCKLILHGRAADKLEALSQELDTYVYTMIFDMGDGAAMADAVANIPSAFRDIDLLINNAGLALGQEPFHHQPVEDYDTMIDVNCRGLIHLTRLILPGMTQRRRGHIINIGSTAGNYPYPGGHVYCASKAFVKQFSLSLRADLQGTNVRVTNIEPGMVATQFSQVRFKGDTERAEKVYRDTAPLTADDIAETVCWTACMPEHVNINRLELMPTVQSFAGHPVERFEEE